eukprot:m.69606 g.69606  ORF g.69606 m.69606 type:complete len:219 (-) comp11637_c0_seq1:55-711(-)
MQNKSSLTREIRKLAFEYVVETHIRAHFKLLRVGTSFASIDAAANSVRLFCFMMKKPCKTSERRRKKKLAMKCKLPNCTFFCTFKETTEVTQSASTSRRIKHGRKQKQQQATAALSSSSETVENHRFVGLCAAHTETNQRNRFQSPPIRAMMRAMMRAMRAMMIVMTMVVTSKRGRNQKQHVICKVRLFPLISKHVSIFHVYRISASCIHPPRYKKYV